MKRQVAKNRLPGPMRSVIEHLGRGGITAMAVAAVAVIVAGILANLPAVYLGNIVDMIVSSSPTASVWPLFALIVAVLFGRILLVVLQKFLVERTAVALQRDVSFGNVRKILAIRVDAIQTLRAGEVAARLDKRVHGMVRLIKLVFLDAIPQIAIAIPAVIFAFNASALAGSVLLSVLALSALVTAVQVRSQKGIRITLINKTAGMAGQISELVGHLDFVRASGMGKHVERRFDHETREIRDVEFRHHKWMMGFDAIKGLIEDVGQALVVGIGIALVVKGTMTPGTILTLAMLYKAASIPLQNLHRVVDELHESFLQVNAAAAVVDPPDDPSLTGDVDPAFSTGAPIVRARGLSLKRDSHDGEPLTILNGIDLEIHADEIVGIAGTSGGGKTTLLRAILGLLPDYEGQLEVFGAEVRDLCKERHADEISYGPQKPYVRQGTVRTNIIEGVTRNGEVSDEILLDALKSARLKVDLDKVLDERGDNISPGQVQRLSLARVFAKKNARFVVLDEATSGLDGSTQAELMEELRVHAKGRALVMVAHRLDTLRWADRIIVLDQGRIVQTGTYGELSSTSGPFAKLLGEEPSVQQIAAE